MNDTLEFVRGIAVGAEACFNVSCCLSSLGYNNMGKLSVTQGEKKRNGGKENANRVEAKKRTRGKRVKARERENLAIL